MRKGILFLKREGEGGKERGERGERGEGEGRERGGGGEGERGERGVRGVRGVRELRGVADDEKVMFDSLSSGTQTNVLPTSCISTK